MNEPVELVISLTLDDGNGEKQQALTDLLRSRIKELNVLSVKPISASNKSASNKSDGLKELGDIAVTLAPIIIPPLFELVKKFIEQKLSKPDAVIKVWVGPDKYFEYDPTRTSDAELEKLLNFLQPSKEEK